MGKELSRIVVRTDHSVDCSSPASIVADVCRGCRSDRDKAVAIYNFLVRTVYMPNHSHRPVEPADEATRRKVGLDLWFVNDPIKYVTVYGCCGCGPQAHLFATLLGQAGLSCRLLAPGFGHVSTEVRWGGKWHWLDVWLPAYVTDGTGEICCYDELMADRSLVADALAEGRASGNFICNRRDHLPAVIHAGRHKPGGRAGYRQTTVEDLRLRPGESCTWLWGNVGKWYWPAAYYPGELPCGPAFKYTGDRHCADAFEHWRPYRKLIRHGPHAPDNVYYRYYGNAIFECCPPLTRRGLKGVGAKLEHVAFAGGGVRCGRAPKGGGAAVGSIEIDFALPYVIADTEIAGTADVPCGAISFCYSLDGGRNWLLGGEVRKSGSFGPIHIGRPNTYEYPAGSTTGRYGFRLRVVLRGGEAGKAATLKSMIFTNTTMLNFYSRPWLEVGANTVTVTALGGKAVRAAPLEVTWRWLEDWKDEKSFTHKVARSGAKAVIKVGGRKRPKMKSITIARPAAGPGRNDE